MAKNEIDTIVCFLVCSLVVFLLGFLSYVVIDWLRSIIKF